MAGKEGLALQGCNCGCAIIIIILAVLFFSVALST